MYRPWVVFRFVSGGGGVLADKILADKNYTLRMVALLVNVDDAKGKKPYLLLKGCTGTTQEVFCTI